MDSKTTIRGAIVVSLFFGVLPAIRGQEKTVGGHTAVLVPLVTTGGGSTNTIADIFTIGFPTGISVKGSGNLIFDFEFVPLIQDNPRKVDVVVHPGLIWKLPRGFAAGGRLAFHTSSTQFGFTPVFIKSWPVEHSFFQSYFLEFDFPVRWATTEGSPTKNTFTFALHFGVAF